MHSWLTKALWGSKKVAQWLWVLLKLLLSLLSSLLRLLLAWLPLLSFPLALFLLAMQVPFVREQIGPVGVKIEQKVQPVLDKGAEILHLKPTLSERIAFQTRQLTSTSWAVVWAFFTHPLVLLLSGSLLFWQLGWLRSPFNF